MDVNTFGEYVTIVAEEDGVTIIGLTRGNMYTWSSHR